MTDIAIADYTHSGSPQLLHVEAIVALADSIPLKPKHTFGEVHTCAYNNNVNSIH